jgi:hypothetical protein
VSIFVEKGSELSEAEEDQFSLEERIQEITDAKLKKLFGLDLVNRNFIWKVSRRIHWHISRILIDLELELELEYKKDRNISVVDQDLTYLYFMLSYKADVILEITKKMWSLHTRGSISLNLEDVDWWESRVYFVAPEFTKYQNMS